MTKNTISNFLFSVIIYFVALTIISAMIKFLLFRDSNYEFMYLRIIISIYIAINYRIKFSKEQEYEG